MHRTALGGVLMIVAGAGAAQATPRLAGIPAQVAHAPVITAPNANSTIVALKQTRTLIDWSSFDISKGQQVDFLFQSNSGIVLNRVSGPAMIDGKLLGCVVTCGAGGSIGGNVWIYSPSGVIFGSNAQVNVGGLLATTSPLLSTTDFLNGGLSFKFGGGAADGRVLVQSGAQIYTRGSLALIAPSVTTQAGSLIDVGGTALYGAAESYVIHFNDTANGLNLLDFEVPATALQDGTVSSTPLTIAGQTTASQVIVAAVSKPSVMNAVISLGGLTTATTASDGGGGDIVLSATGAAASVDVAGALRASRSISLQASGGGAVTVSGSVTAASATGAGGAIQLGGAGTGSVDLTTTGALNASSTGQGQVGGSVIATGASVRVDGAVSATGPAGGGRVLVGGGAQGQDASVADATTTSIGAGAVLDASATAKGAGGQVVVWSNQATQFQGSVASRGGPSGGVGGSAEVSSGGYLSYAGATDLRASDGTAGQLLLDPSELIIVPTGGADTVASGANAAAATASSTLGADAIDTALQSADLTISTHMSASHGDGVIEFDGGTGPLSFSNSGTANRTLTFVAERGFLFDTSVSATGPLNLTLDAGASRITIPTGGDVQVANGVLTLTATDLSLQGNLTAGTIDLIASSNIDQTGGILTAGSLTATATRGISLIDANAVASIGGLSNAGVGGIAFTNTGNLSLDGDVFAPAQHVSLLSSSGGIIQNSGVITAAFFGAGTGGALSLTGSNAIASVIGLNSGGAITFNDALGFTLDGDVYAPGASVSLVSNGGAITQVSDVITAATFSASATTGLSLGGNNQIGQVASLSNSGSGGLTFNDNQSVTIGSVTLGGGDISLSTSAGDLTLTNAVTSPGAMTLVAGGNLTGTALTSAGDLTLTSNDTFSGAISFNSITVGGNATYSATTMNTGTLETMFTGAASNLSLTFTTTLGETDISGATISAPGSVSVSASNDALFVGSITAGANVMLSTPGSLFSGEGGGITAANLTASAVTGLELDGSNHVASVTSLTDSASGELFFNNGQSVTIGSVSQGGSGEIGLSTNVGNLTLTSGITSTGFVSVSAQGDVTVNGVSSAEGINLSAGGALTEVAGAVITTGGNYSGAGMTINAAAAQPVFTSSFGNLDLDFTQTGGSTDLTGVALSAPGSVFVGSSENLKIASITSGGSVQVNSNGVLSAAPGAAITLTSTYPFNDVEISAQSIDVTNPAVVQPVFPTGTFDSLNIFLNQVGGTVSLVGAPLSAPSVTVNAGNAALTLDTITAGSDGVNVSSSGNLQVASITTPGSITLSTGGAISAASGAMINLGGNYNLTAQTVDLTNTNNVVTVVPTFAATSGGDLTLLFTQSNGLINLSNASLFAPGSVSVSLSSSASNENLTVGSVTTTFGDVTLYTGSFETGGGALVVGSINAGSDVTLQTTFSTNTDFEFPVYTGGPITSGPITAGGSVTAVTGAISTSAFMFDNVSAGGSVTLATGFYDGGDLTVGTVNATEGQVNLSTGVSENGTLTTGSITAGSDVTLVAGGALQAVGEGVTVQTGGSYSATGSTIDQLLYQPTFTGEFGDLSLTFNGSGGGDLTNHPLSALGGSVSVTANNGDLTVDAITALNDITLFAAGNLMAAEVTPAPVMTLGGNYSATGGTIDSTLFQPHFNTGSNGNLSLTFNAGEGSADLTGHPLMTLGSGSVSITDNSSGLIVDSIAAGGDITLIANGPLQAAEVSPFAIMLGGNYSATGTTIDSRLYQPNQPNFTGFGDLSLTFTGGAADLTDFPLHAPGSVSVTAESGNLTVDSITAGVDVSLAAPQATVIVAPDAIINLSGTYNLTESTIDPSSLHPAFAPDTFGDFNLTVFGSGGANLTGIPLFAPGSVTISATSGNLTVDSITAQTGGITLSTSMDLANASGAVMSLDGDYSATGATISTGLLQPTFMAGSFGSLSLTFNQSGSSVDLTGTPLTAPGTITINVNGTNENLTVDTLTATGGDVVISDYYYNSGTITAGAVNAGGSVNISTANYYGGALTVGAVNAGGSVNLSTGYGASAPLIAGAITAGGDVTLSTGYYAGGTLMVSSISAGGAVSLSAGGSLTAASTTTAGGSIDFSANNGPLTVGVLTAAGDVSLYDASGNIIGASATGVTLGGSYSASATTIDTRLYQPTFTSGSDGSLSLTFRQTGGLIDLTGFPLTAPSSIFLSSSESLTVDSLTAGAGSYVEISASGALNEVGGAVITAQNLYASAESGLVLNGPNAVALIDELENSESGGISFTNQGDIHIHGSVEASGQTVNLVSNTGSVVEDDCGYYCNSVIFANTLTASAVTGINLTDIYYNYYTNQINNIGPVINTGSGGINILNYSNLTLVGDVSAPGQAVNIVTRFGALNQTGGAITAATFTATAVSGITLNDANAVAMLGALSNSDSGGISFTNAGDLLIAGAITAELQTVNLVSNGGAVTEGAEGLITAQTLTGSGATGFHLDQDNVVARVGDLANTGSGGISFTDAGDVFLTGDVTAAGQLVSFVSDTGVIHQSTGVVTAGTLDLTAVSGIDLSGANAVDQLGAITTGSGNVNFVNAGDFTLIDALNLGSQSLSLASNGGSISESGGAITAGALTVSAAGGISLTGANAPASLDLLQNGPTGGIAYTSGGNLTLAIDVDGFGQTVSLNSQTGALSQTGGAILGQTVDLTAATSVNLTSVTAATLANVVGGGLTLTAGEGGAPLTALTVAIGNQSGLVNVGDGVTGSGGLAVSNATFNAIQADTIEFYAGYFKGDRLADLGPSTGSIKVGTLSWNTTGLTGLVDGSTLGFYAGPNSTISVQGSITPTTVAMGHVLIGDSVADTWTPKDILISGGLGATGSTLQELASVELNAVSAVVLGQANFQTAVENAIAAGQTSSINVTAGIPGGLFSANNNAIFVGANSLTIRAQGAIVSQNTGGGSADGGVELPNDNRAATVLTLGTTLPATSSPTDAVAAASATPTITPVVVDLFGSLTDSTGLVLNLKDVAPSSEIVLESPLQISDSYRFNSCTIGKTNVCVVQFLPVKLILGVVLVTDSPAAPPSYTATPILTLKPLQPNGDPTLTGVGNEEIWRAPSCDPNAGDQPCT